MRISARLTSIIVCSALLIAAYAATAQASWILPAHPTATAQQLLDRYLPVARAAWPDSPCLGQEHVTLNDDHEITAVVALNPSGYLDGTRGLAYGMGVSDPASPDFCRAGLSSDLVRDAPAFCSVLVHELGHLADRQHTDDPTDVMNPRVPIYGPCAPSTPGEILDGLVRRGLPRPDAWTLTCMVIHGGEIGCRVAAPFARLVRQAYVSPDLTRVWWRAREGA